jgi:hypothetical protein
VKWIGDGLRGVSHTVREVADSFAHAIEQRFSGSITQNFRSLLHRSPTRAETPIELKNFGLSGLDNSTYGAVENVYASAVGQPDTGAYASLSDVKAASPGALGGRSEYVNLGSGSEYVNTARQDLTGEYIDFDPSPIYANLGDIAAGLLESDPSFKSLVKGLESFVPNAQVPADTSFYENVTRDSSPALKESLSFVRQVIDHHGSSGGKALVKAGILNDKEIIGQITPELFNTFQVKLKEAKASTAAKLDSGFQPTSGQLRYERLNSDNANSPIHDVLREHIFTSSPKLAGKVKWEFDRVLASGARSAPAIEIAQSVARQVLAEVLKESFDAGRSDSPFHEVFGKSSLANVSSKKLESIKAVYDSDLSNAAFDYIYENGFDKPFDSEKFKGKAIEVAQAAIQKYIF